MNAPAPKPIRSPSYPAVSLRDAIANVRKIEASYRRSPVDRVAGAKLIGYTSLSGPANKGLAALAQYGLVERAGKGEMRVTTLAQAILHPNNPEEQRRAYREAAFGSSPLFQELQERWPNMVPPEDGVITYLNRQGFNQSAIKPAARAYLQTLAFLEEAGASESHGEGARQSADSGSPDHGGDEVNPVVYGGAKVGDLVQWESKGVLQLPKAARVRALSEDGEWVAIEGSETGIRMNEILVESRASAAPTPPPHFAFLEPQHEKPEAGETEWMRLRPGADTKVRLLVSGEMGPREIKKLIKLLEAQRAVLDDDDD